MNRSELVSTLTRPIYAYHDEGGCTDGPRCVWCPAERIADHLIAENVVAIDTASLRTRLRDVLAAHGRVPLDDIDQTVTEIMTAITGGTP